MSTHGNWPGRVAVAIRRGEEPEVLLAEDVETLGRVLALRVVARAEPGERAHANDAIREALLEQRWGDAVVEWMQSSGEIIDAYPDEEVWTRAVLNDETTAFELRMAPIFRNVGEP